MAKINVKQIQKKLQKPVLKVATNAQKELVDIAQEKMLSEFDSHPVTKEINAGPSSPNISRTIGGVSEKNKGNLFSFIGFEAGSNPIGPVRKELAGPLFLDKARRVLPRNQKIVYEYRVRFPLDDILFESPLPFEQGRSWVEGISTRISGIGNFLFVKRQSSRAGVGIQIPYDTKKIFIPISYILGKGGILENFFAELKKTKLPRRKR